MAITMRDVARRANTSVATVSKCLHGVATIPLSTRQRVCAIAEEMGYQVHPFISALMKSRRKRETPTKQELTLAYVTAFPTEHGWKNVAFFKALFDGAQACAQEHGYKLTPFWLYRDGMTNERFSEVLWARGIRGMLLNPFPSFGAHLELEWSKFCVVAHGLSLTTPVFHRTSNDHHQSMMLAMTECKNLGYERPGFVIDAATSKRLEYRWEGAYTIAREKFGFKKTKPLLLAERWQVDETCKWIKKEKPDVVITLMLEEDVDEFKKRGVRVPEDVGLVSLSVAYAGSPLSGICQNPAGMGAVAAAQLINMVERNETGIPKEPITLTIEGQWNPGQTVRHADPARLLTPM